MERTKQTRIFRKQLVPETHFFSAVPDTWPSAPLREHILANRAFWKDKRALVTDALGFLGGHLCRVFMMLAERKNCRGRVYNLPGALHAATPDVLSSLVGTVAQLQDDEMASCPDSTLAKLKWHRGCWRHEKRPEADRDFQAKFGRLTHFGRSVAH